mgnify:CR=1 FL=1
MLSTTVRISGRQETEWLYDLHKKNISQLLLAFTNNYEELICCVVIYHVTKTGFTDWS